MLTTARCTMSMVEPGALMFPATELADLSDSTGIVQPRSGGLLACCPALLLAIRLFTISQYFPSYFPSFLPSHDSPVRRHRRLLIWRLACWLAAAGLLGSGDAFHTITVVQSVIIFSRCGGGGGGNSPTPSAPQSASAYAALARTTPHAD